MKNKVCVYTCITGNYDNLKEIENKEKEIDYYCFTNNKKIKSKTWKIIYIEDENLTNVQLARKIKILGHPIINENYEVLLWMDGAVVFRKKIMDFINTYLTNKDSFVAFKHSERNNIKEECNAVLQSRKETKENIKRILHFYKKENYLDNNGLIESTVYIKRTNDKLVNKTMKLWFKMIMKFTKRDQLSFNYCIFKIGLEVKWISEKVFDNNWFSWEMHNNDSKNKSYRVYFDDENLYNIDNDYQGELKEVKNNEYMISIESPIDCVKTVIELPKISYIFVNNIVINDVPLEKIKHTLFNAIEYNDGYVFYNLNPAFEFYDRIKKNEYLIIKLSIKKMTLEEIKEAFEKIIENQKQIIQEYKTENFNLSENNEKNRKELQKIINSKSWKLLRKLDKIRSINRKGK